jgi:hypothetical protein
MCEGIPPPKKQYNLRSNRLFLNEPICHCQHWAREAIDALLDAGVLEPLGPDDNGGIQKRPDTVLAFARGVKRLSRSRATRNSNNLKEIHSTPSLDATSIGRYHKLSLQSEELGSEAIPPQSIIPKLFITARTCSKFLRESNQTAPTTPSTVEAIVVRDTSSP